MSDIAERMRNRIIETYAGHGQVAELPDDECVEAADEITRLRADLAAACEEIGLLSEHRNMMRTERDKARADLATARVFAAKQGGENEELQEELDKARTNLATARAALRFYANPFELTDIHGDDVRVPDFYSELNFGETAEKTLAAIKGTKDD